LQQTAPRHPTPLAPQIRPSVEQHGAAPRHLTASGLAALQRQKCVAMASRTVCSLSISYPLFLFTKFENLLTRINETANQCIQDFGHLSNTSCADNSWTLWNTTTADYPIGFFCCLPGQLGTQDGYCVPPNGLDGAQVAVRVCASFSCPIVSPIPLCFFSAFRTILAERGVRYKASRIRKVDENQ
jgi:hypothetical protein